MKPIEEKPLNAKEDYEKRIQEIDFQRNLVSLVSSVVILCLFFYLPEISNSQMGVLFICIGCFVHNMVLWHTLHGLAVERREISQKLKDFFDEEETESDKEESE